MEKSIIIISIIIFLIVLGCTLPIERNREERRDVSPKTEKTDSEEKEELKKKIAELEKEKLEQKIEELEKKVEGQRTQTEKKVEGQRTQTPVKTAPKIKTKKPPRGFVRVNSPGDGFLALRSAPSTERGGRILTIPHGTLISVYNCTGVKVVAGRSGRWCQTVYEDNQGWVFDAYLIK